LSVPNTPSNTSYNKIRGKKSDSTIDHFTLVCLVAWHLNESEAGVERPSNQLYNIQLYNCTTVQL